MKIKYILIVFCSAFAMYSCELDRVPQGQISSENFWKTRNDVNLALMGCYAYIGGNVYDAYQDGYADNSYCQYPWESNATVVAAGNINTDMDDGYNFTGIRRFNYFLENIDKVQVVDEKLKEQYKSEVRVLRAWTYFNLANKFGAVPLFEKYITEVEEATIAPTSEDDIIKFVLKEISEAVPNLSTELVKSRISKGAALSIKARIELAYGKWEDAVNSSKQVMGMGYKLFEVGVNQEDYANDDYSKFITFKDDKDKEAFYKGLKSYEQQFWDVNKENSEVILNSEFIPDSYNYIAVYLLPDNAGGGWSSITPTVELVNSYWGRDGKTFTPPTKDARATAYNKGNYSLDYLNEFKNRDTRLYATILFPGAIWKALLGTNDFTWPKTGSNISKTGYNYRKFVDPDKNIWKKEQDYPIIRYAEVLLTYAEAKNELSGPDNSVFDAIDELRSRVGMPELDRNTNSTKEAMRETIRNERRIELAGEGLRWLDIRRWGISKDVMKTIYAIDGDLAQERKWDEKYKRLPYPQAAVDLNTNLKDAQAAKGY